MASEGNPNAVGATARTWQKAAQTTRRGTGDSDGLVRAHDGASISAGLERSIAAQPLRALIYAFAAGLIIGKCV